MAWLKNGKTHIIMQMQFAISYLWLFQMWKWAKSQEESDMSISKITRADKNFVL